MSDDLTESALHYHRYPVAGKLAIVATKPLANQRDLALAYSPGVAAACDAIEANPDEAATLTARANLVGIVTNGTAVLGLGSIGALASKPVMEGKAVLFKKFSGIDAFDIEVNELDPDRFVDIVAALEPTFGGINLEDIKAPECFEIERKLRERMGIPVFHDDQHGTAIIVSAAVINGLRVVGKSIEQARLVASGAGAASLACLDLLVSLGMPQENIVVTDIEGVVYTGRTALMDIWKARYAIDTEARTLADVIPQADVFLGLSAPGVLSGEMVKSMADRPLIFALANPDPEITPEEAREARPDAVIATGRSDYPNQVNNVLCFPFLFRGALDVGATEINEPMKLACVHALADLALAESSDLVAKAFGGEPTKFGPDYLIPKLFDPRLITQLSPAVAKAAMASGVATRPITDFDAYTEKLTGLVFCSGFLMKPIFERARNETRRLVFAEGEDPRVLQAAKQVSDEGIAFPILIGRADVINARIERLGLRIQAGVDFELVNILSDPRYQDYWSEYHRVLGRYGVTPDVAKTVIRSQGTAVAAIMLRRKEVDAMLCGAIGRFQDHYQHVEKIIGRQSGVRDMSALIALILPTGTFFFCDTHISADPSADELAEMTMLAAEEVTRFGIAPKIALLSRSNFGTHDSPEANKMAEAVRILRQRAPELEVDGEMHADAALLEELRNNVVVDTRLSGQANLFIMPTSEAAHISYNLVKVLGGGIAVGPILIGAAQSAHVVTHSISVRGLVNMAAVAVCRSVGASS